ncbi:MAG: RNA polymerase sigma factor [Lachnospiraceae bacterium]|nr:RNA polymerase sigma factor [Lachnospiraceae bacterium]
MTREAFEELVLSMGTDVYSFCLQLVRNKEDAEELYQETMLAALERHKKIDASGNPKSYLLGIVIGLWKNRRRKLARRGRICPQTALEEQLEEVYPSDTGHSPEERIIRKESVDLVRKLTEELPEKYRIPVYLYYSRELSLEEIAAAMHIPKGTVKSRLYKARAILKSRLEEENYGLET